MARNNFAVVLFVLVVSIASENSAGAYTLEYGKFGDVNFPRQFASGWRRPTHFVRAGGGSGDSRRKEFACPESYVFDATQMKCTKSDDFSDNLANVCPPDFGGLLPYSMNCRKFLNCWYGQTYISPCSSYLLFDNRTKECNYPEMAGCCEYEAFVER